MKLSSTRQCGRTPAILLALEELDLSCALETLPDGAFLERYQRVGPILEDGALVLFEHNAMLRHLARTHPTSPLSPRDEAESCVMDQWMDFSLSQVRASVARLGEAMHANPGAPPPGGLVPPVKRALGVLDAAVKGREYLMDRFTFADCAFAGLERVTQMGALVDELSAMQAWMGRLASRPAWARMRARLE